MKLRHRYVVIGRHFNQCVTFILPFKVLSYLHITGTPCSPPFLCRIFLCFPPAHIHKSELVESAMDCFDVFEIISVICWFREEMVQAATSWKCSLSSTWFVFYSQIYLPVLYVSKHSTLKIGKYNIKVNDKYPQCFRWLLECVAAVLVWSPLVSAPAGSLLWDELKPRLRQSSWR